MSNIIVEKVDNSKLQLIGEAKESKAGKRFLGTLKGICADLKESTRNGRKYTEQLWEKVINSDEFKEGMENGTLYGELGHPEERLETLPERVAIALANVEFDKGQGKLIGTFDILDTPMGQILKSLVDYGSKLGISSRGGGDTIYREGQEYVDEDTFRFEAFDIVLLPAVKAARLSLTEGQDKKLALLKESVQKVIDTSENKEEITEALKDLKLPEIDTVLVSMENKSNDIAAESSGADNIMKDLEEAIQKSITLEEENATLRDKVTAVSNRETKLVEELEKAKVAVRKLSLKRQQANIGESVIADYKKKFEALEVENRKLKESVEQARTSKKVLVESRSLLSESIKASQKQIEALKESLKVERNENEQEIRKLIQLNESIKKDTQIEVRKTERKLSEAVEINKQMNSKLSESLNAYLSVICRSSGVDEQDVKNKLNENFTVKDIDNAVSRLSDYNLRIGSLPFATSRVSATIQGSKEPIFEKKEKLDEDKQISPELLKML